MPVYRLSVTPAMDGQTLRHIVLCKLGLSNGQFKRAKFQGSIRVDDVPALANQRLTAGEVLVLDIPEGDNTAPEPYALPLSIPYEDEYFMIVDKPAPLPAASSSKQAAPTLENAVFSYLGCPQPFVYRPVNRLDKGTSGLMLVAKTAHAQHLLQQQLHSDSFVREYLAVTEGCPSLSEGVIDLPIAKVDAASIKREIRPDGKPARTYYRVIRQSASRTLFRLRLDTGRTHQIRVHLSALGCPICGDFLYGTELCALPGRFALHSAHCAVRHPITGAWIERESPLPPALSQLLDEKEQLL